MAGSFCRATRSKPSWTHARCWGCVDLPTELMHLATECEPEESDDPPERPPPYVPERPPVLPPPVQMKLDDDERSAVFDKLREALALRDKYRGDVEHGAEFDDHADDDGMGEEPLYDPFVPPPWAALAFSFQQRRGMFAVWEESEMARVGNLRGAKDTRTPTFGPPSTLAEYTSDLARLVAITVDPAVNSYCYGRLQMLEARFRLHRMDHEVAEAAEQRGVPHRDFYNVRKVDTHVHLAAAMNQKHLLRFIKRKIRQHSDDVVTRDARTGEEQTLAMVFDEMGLTEHDLCIDRLGMSADADTFARFDKFNMKYNPLGKSKLREIFLKTDNAMGGRYFAEMTQVGAYCSHAPWPPLTFRGLLSPSMASSHLPWPPLTFHGLLSPPLLSSPLPWPALLSSPPVASAHTRPSSSLPQISLPRPFVTFHQPLLPITAVHDFPQELFDDMAFAKYQKAEYRISIYGRKQVRPISRNLPQVPTISHNLPPSP